MAKKVTDISGTAKKSEAAKGKTTKAASKTPEFKASPKAKKEALTARIIAGLAFLGAIAFQGIAIFYILKNGEYATIWIPIVLMLVDFAFALVGAFFWKKSNKIDPPSEQNQFLFFMQSQLAAVVAVIAFLPLIVMVLLNKNISGKNKAVFTGVAVVLMAVAAFFGTELDPASIEKYTAQTAYVESLTGQDKVYGTKSGSKFHLYQDCPHLKADKVTDIFGGSVADLHEKNHRIGTGQDALCATCKKRALKAKLEKASTEEEKQQIEDQINGVEETPETTE